MFVAQIANGKCNDFESQGAIETATTTASKSVLNQQTRVKIETGSCNWYRSDSNHCNFK